ncbi:hypothetical protein [Kibdelosporangium philippinense]|uniref:hypothetical protein n=1 Tax=Kibdelosporangium philippinense TaxID=211113 RepID=UPI0036194C81
MSVNPSGASSTLPNGGLRLVTAAPGVVDRIAVQQRDGRAVERVEVCMRAHVVGQHAVEVEALGGEQQPQRDADSRRRAQPSRDSPHHSCRLAGLDFPGEIGVAPIVSGTSLKLALGIVREETAANVGPAGIEIVYERFGDPADPPVLLIMGGNAR